MSADCREVATHTATAQDFEDELASLCQEQADEMQRQAPRLTVESLLAVKRRIEAGRPEPTFAELREDCRRDMFAFARAFEIPVPASFRDDPANRSGVLAAMGPLFIQGPKERFPIPLDGSDASPRTPKVNKKPSMEEVVAYAKPLVRKFIATTRARELPKEQREEVEQSVMLRVLEAYAGLDPDAGWKSYVYNHARGGVLDYMKFGRGFQESRWSLGNKDVPDPALDAEPAEDEDDALDGLDPVTGAETSPGASARIFGSNSPAGLPTAPRPHDSPTQNTWKLNARIGLHTEAGDDMDIEHVLGSHGIHHEPAAGIHIRWDLVARMASQDIELHAFAKWIRGFSIQDMTPVFRLSRARVGQLIAAFIVRFRCAGVQAKALEALAASDESDLIEIEAAIQEEPQEGFFGRGAGGPSKLFFDPWFRQTCFAFGLSDLVGFKDEDQSPIFHLQIGTDLEPVDLDSHDAGAAQETAAPHQTSLFDGPGQA